MVAPGAGGWRVRRLALVGVTALLLLLPWALYQAFYDPPGNRLIKMHLAGVERADDERSSLQAIRDAYRDTPWDTLARNKRSNFRVTYGYATLRSWVALDRPALREGQFYAIFQTLGVLNLGFPIAAVLVARRWLGVPWRADLAPHLTLIVFSLAV
jgi:hypothetical protein